MTQLNSCKKISATKRLKKKIGFNSTWEVEAFTIEPRVFEFPIALEGDAIQIQRRCEFGILEISIVIKM